MLGSSGNSSRSRLATCSGDQKSPSQQFTWVQRRPRRSLCGLGGSDAEYARWGAPPARYCDRWALAATSRQTVETERPIRRLMALHDSPVSRPRLISSRSASCSLPGDGCHLSGRGGSFCSTTDTPIPVQPTSPPIWRRERPRAWRRKAIRFCSAVRFLGTGDSSGELMPVHPLTDPLAVIPCTHPPRSTAPCAYPQSFLRLKVQTGR